MFWLKCCPRCCGDLYQGHDVYGRYVACLQCGHYLTQAEEVVLRYSSLSISLTPVTEALAANHRETDAPEAAGILVPVA